MLKGLKNTRTKLEFVFLQEHRCLPPFWCHIVFYFIVSGEINVYLVKIKVVSITSEMILYHFTIVTDTIYIFTPCFGRLRFSSLFQMWILPPLQIFEHL